MIATLATLFLAVLLASLGVLALVVAAQVGHRLVRRSWLPLLLLALLAPTVTGCARVAPPRPLVGAELDRAETAEQVLERLSTALGARDFVAEAARWAGIGDWVAWMDSPAADAIAVTLQETSASAARGSDSAQGGVWIIPGSSIVVPVGGQPVMPEDYVIARGVRDMLGASALRSRWPERDPWGWAWLCGVTELVGEVAPSTLRQLEAPEGGVVIWQDRVIDPDACTATIRARGEQLAAGQGWE